jgi:integrase
MGVFSRKDSPYWWLWLATALPGQQKERTAVKIGNTSTQRHDSRHLAEEIYFRRMNEIAARVHRLPVELPAIRFDKYADLYARDVLPHHKGAERDREVLKILRRGFTDEVLSTIDRDRVRQWMTERRAQTWRGAPISARTVNREVDLLKAMLRDAVPKYLAASPIAGMKRLKIVKPKRRLMTPTEEQKLLPHLRPDDRAIVLMGLDTLCRLGDILDLKREDDDGTHLYISDPKDPNQSEPYRVPISRRLRKALNAVPERGPYYFPKRRIALTDRDRRNTIRQMLEYACRKADLPFGRAENGLTFHWATRRTGATRMIQRKVDLKTVQAIGHWKTADVVLDIYAEANPMAARAAVEIVGGLPRLSRKKRKRA